MWAYIEEAKQKSESKMEWEVSRGIWLDQSILIQPTSVRTSTAWHPSHPLSHNNGHSSGGHASPENTRGGKVVYYVSKKFLKYETCNTPLEKISLALVLASKKLMHYILTDMVHVVVPMDPIRFLLQQPMISAKVAM